MSSAKKPGWRAQLSWPRAFTAAVFGLAVVGLVVLCLAVPKGIAVVVALGIVAFAVMASLPTLGARVLALLCAALLGLLALLTLAVIIRWGLDRLSIEGRLPIPVGLLIGFVAFAGVAFWYLVVDWTATFERSMPDHFKDWPRRHALIAAPVLAVLIVLVPPRFLGQEKPASVPKSQRVVAHIDALIVSDPPRPGEASAASAESLDVALRGGSPPYSHAAGFKVRYSVGFRDGNGVRWTMNGTNDPAAAVKALTAPDAPDVAAPTPLNDADRVLVLLVDGTPGAVGDPADWDDLTGRAGEVTRWRRVAAAAAPAGTTSYALLETTSSTRLRDWRGQFIQPGTRVRRGAAVSIQGLGSRSVTDSAVRLAVAAPSAQEDFSLALRHRPILRFDSAESAPRPLAIDELFRDEKVQLCTDQRRGSTACERVTHAEHLKNGGTHLQLDVPRESALRALAQDDLKRLETVESAPSPAPSSPVAPPPSTPPPAAEDARPVGDGSAIYVRAVPVDSEDARHLYLDYWWYLPYNPAGAGSGAFCGPGLLIPGISCFDHVSDWEGVTVVLERTKPGAEPTPIAVHYAQHASVVRYRWDDLEAAWSGDRATNAMRATPESAARPLVFVADGTHAAYPMPCASKPKCRQPIGGAEENRHDGRLPWSGNDAVQCGTTSCLKMLPTSRGGRDPALWNGFEGPWGKRNCFMTYYCDSSSPPAAPGQQERYQEPWHYDKEASRPRALR